ncbi:hypothetical protein CTEN210_04360 [Chaetoceros tenuissimus]|uniref:Fe2OG dioxygenase domain-containing protein n=1 Tax=Chaetoceros tenuissimus TaxID=426638 RepID=A0AAD3H2V5_9STRA|nr:hypothetical protein CTEN210_04360 [Chaetoceros tenuissimus]
MKYTNVIPLLHLGALALQTAAKDVTEQTKDSFEEKNGYSVTKHEKNINLQANENSIGLKQNMVEANVQSRQKDESCSALDQARRLEVPKAKGTIDAEFEHADFWDEHGDLIKLAWSELSTSNSNETENAAISNLQNIIHPSFYSAVEATHRNPTEANEEVIWSHMKEAGPPGKSQAYKTQLLTDEGLRLLRSELDRATSSGILMRRPNAMNRYGCIIDREVNGAVSLPTLTSLVKTVVSKIGRPLGRMLFADAVGEGDDCEYFAFTIRYNAEEDLELKEHRDASVITLNINLNLPEETYDGSSLYLVDDEKPLDFDVADDYEEERNKRYSISFDPGMMLIHRGSTQHAALPIKEGTRHNLVIWVFGAGGDVRIAPYEKEDWLGVSERWGK